MAGKLTAIQARVHGRVQGVGFRYATHREARRLSVTGWVRNRGDGTVEVYAEGSEEAVRALESWLGSGPPGARVTSVDIRRPVPTDAYPRFTIEG